MFEASCVSRCPGFFNIHMKNAIMTMPLNLKVAFIGISNWALDPAKMNRGILVQRDVPDIEELAQTAQ